MEHGEGEEYAQGTWDRRARHKPFRNGRGLSRQSRPARGGADVRMAEAGRGRKGPSDGRDPGGDMDLGKGQGWQKGGNQTRDVRQRIVQGTTLWPPREGGKHRKSVEADGWGRCIGGQSLYNRDNWGGGRSG